MRYLFLIFLSTLGFPTIAVDYFQPPGIFTHSPAQTFTHQKSWFYFSGNQNSYIYQAYLPDFSKEDVEFKISKRLVQGFQLDISAQKWKTKNSGFLPIQELLNFSQTINIPKSKHEDATSSFVDNILTIKIPTIQE